MPKVVDSKIYLCNICSKKYTTQEEARNCENHHDLIFLPIEREDLQRLILFITTGEQRVLTSSLLEVLYRYSGTRKEL